jgi:hypothetical protein
MIAEWNCCVCGMGIASCPFSTRSQSDAFALTVLSWFHTVNPDSARASNTGREFMQENLFEQAHNAVFLPEIQAMRLLAEQ